MPCFTVSALALLAVLANTAASSDSQLRRGATKSPKALIFHRHLEYLEHGTLRMDDAKEDITFEGQCNWFELPINPGSEVCEEECKLSQLPIDPSSRICKKCKPFPLFSGTKCKYLTEDMVAQGNKYATSYICWPLSEGNELCEGFTLIPNGNEGTKYETCRKVEPDVPEWLCVTTVSDSCTEVKYNNKSCGGCKDGENGFEFDCSSEGGPEGSEFYEMLDDAFNSLVNA